MTNIKQIIQNWHEVKGKMPSDHILTGEDDERFVLNYRINSIVPMINSAPQTIDTLVKAVEEAMEVIKRSGACCERPDSCSIAKERIDWLERWGK